MSSGKKNYPKREDCLKLLQQVGCPEGVIRHILIVTELALKIAKRFPEVNTELLECGALLHDIGRSRTHGIAHAVEGAKIAREHGLPMDVVNIIERHICAGIPEVDAVKLGLPKKDYIPLTLEEQIVAHADNLFEGVKRCKLVRSLQILRNKGLPEVADRVKKLHEKLSKEAGIDIDDI